MGDKHKRSSTISWDEVWKSYNRKRYEYQLALEEHRVRWERIRQIILEKYGSFLGLNCIEIGAGSGHYSMLFAREGANATLLDYSKEALEFCRNVFKNQRFTNNQVEFVLMDALKLDNSFFGKFDVSMSFGVAEHFMGNDRIIIVKNHLKVLKNSGVAFVSVPNKGCILLRIYQFLMKFVKRNDIEAYPFTRGEFVKIGSGCNVRQFSFIGSSIWETYNPMSFYRRKKGIVRPISKLKKEKRTFLDQYAGREITFVATNG